MNQRILIIGQGGIGLPLARLLAARGHDVTGLSRTPKNLSGSGIRPWQKDALALSAGELDAYDRIAVIITPGQHPDRAQAYRDSYTAVCRHLARLPAPRLKQMLLVSSTSVYGENGGETVDEATPVRPASDTARLLHDAERSLQDAFGGNTVIVRPSGIYGTSRTRMLRLAREAHKAGAADAAWTNRIFDEDLVAVLAQLMQLAVFKPVYLASDFHPATAFEVSAFLCREMKLPPPERLSLPVSGKKIRPNIPRAWLRFPDYRQGYRHILRTLSDT